MRRDKKRTKERKKILSQVSEDGIDRARRSARERCGPKSIAEIKWDNEMGERDTELIYSSKPLSNALSR